MSVIIKDQFVIIQNLHMSPILQNQFLGCCFFCVSYSKGPFKYYVIKEVGGWDQKMAMFDDLQYCKSIKEVGGPKKVKNMMT